MKVKPLVMMLISIILKLLQVRPFVSQEAATVIKLKAKLLLIRSISIIIQAIQEKPCNNVVINNYLNRIQKSTNYNHVSYNTSKSVSHSNQENKGGFIMAEIAKPGGGYGFGPGCGPGFGFGGFPILFLVILLLLLFPGFFGRCY
jgi:hypothetical protein